MVYGFYQILEMNYTHKVFECVARDYHEAMFKAIAEGVDYDAITVNGEWCYAK